MDKINELICSIPDSVAWGICNLFAALTVIAATILASIVIRMIRDRISENKIAKEFEPIIEDLEFSWDDEEIII